MQCVARCGPLLLLLLWCVCLSVGHNHVHKIYKNDRTNWDDVCGVYSWKPTEHSIRWHEVGALLSVIFLACLDLPEVNISVRPSTPFSADTDTPIFLLSIEYDTDTIRDAILTCTRKPTRVGLIYRTACIGYNHHRRFKLSSIILALSLIHIWRCRRSYACRSRWSPYH